MNDEKIKAIENSFYDKLIIDSCGNVSCDECELSKCPVDILNEVLKKEKIND